MGDPATIPGGPKGGPMGPKKGAQRRGPMGTHGDPWGPMGTHGSPWEPMGQRVSVSFSLAVYRKHVMPIHSWATAGIGFALRVPCLLGVAHTICFGCGAHDIFWEWRTRYLSGVAHTIFVGSGAHDIFCWAPWGPGPQQHIFFTGFHYLCNCTHLLASTHSLCPDTTHQRRGSLLET